MAAERTIYVAEFSEGIVKVGVSVNCESRAAQLELFAAKTFGADMREFVGLRVVEDAHWRAQEMATIHAISQEASRIDGFAEWFKGITFDRACHLVRTVSFDGVTRKARTPVLPPVLALTPRQAEVLTFIRNHQARHQYSPTGAEICAHFGHSSANGAYDHIKTLVRKGYLKRSPNTARSLEICEDVIAQRCAL